MVAIVSGHSLGLGLTSLETLGQRGLFGQAENGRSGERVYVNAATGNLVLQDQDDRLVARGLDALALRTYNSQGKFTDDNGDNWGNGVYTGQLVQLDKKIALETAGSKLVRTGMDGNQAIYEYDTVSNRYVSTAGAGAHDFIVHDSTLQQLVWMDGDSQVREFYQAGGKGQLLQRMDAGGNAWSFKYDGKSGVLKEVVSGKESTLYEYEGTRLASISTLTSSNGAKKADIVTRRVHYGYDAQNRLASVTVDKSPENALGADVHVTTYKYRAHADTAPPEDRKLVSEITQTDGSVLTFDYVKTSDGKWRVEAATNALNQKTRYEYNLAAGRTSVTDPLDHVTVFQYDTQTGELLAVEEPAAGGITQVTRFAYNGAGDLESVTDAQGRQVLMEYDARGNQSSRQDAEGNLVTRRYTGANQLRTEALHTAGGLQITRYVYETQAVHGGKATLDRLRFVVSPEGRVTEYRYDSVFGLLKTTVQYKNETYAVPAGMAEGEAPALASLVAWAVGKDTPSHAVRIDMDRDFRGQLESTTQWDDLSTEGEVVTDYVYSAAGELLETIDDEGGKTTYEYDGLGRLERTVNAENEITTTFHDDAGGRTVVTQLASGRTSTSVYDRAGRLASVHQGHEDQALPLASTRYVHDAAGRLVMTEDATGMRNWMVWDASGRKVADVDADGSLVEYVYDERDLLVHTVAYAERLATSALVDGDGQPLAFELDDIRPSGNNPANRRAWYVYDDDGRLVRAVDAQGAVTETTYDEASRVVRVHRYDDTVDTSAFAGPLLAAADVAPEAGGLDRVTRNFYDADGVLRGTLDAEGYLTELFYDAAGRLVQRERYATPTVGDRAAGTLDALRPRADASKAANDQLTTYLLNGRGLVVGEVDADGYLTVQDYDGRGNLVQRTRYHERVTVPVSPHSPVATLVPAAHHEDRTTVWTYDGLNRLKTEVDPHGAVTTYDYDAAGNLVATVQAAGSTESRSRLARFDLLGRVTAELTAEGARALALELQKAQPDVEQVWSLHSTRYRYDAASRRISATDPNGHRTLYFYDADGRMTFTVNAEGEVTEFRYNAFGERELARRYGTAIASEDLADLAGGLDTRALLDALSANSAVDRDVTSSYDVRGAVLFVTDAMDVRTRHEYNTFGEERRRTEAYHESGQLVTRFDRDRRGLVTTTVADPFGIVATTHAEYDAFGRLVRSTDANGGTRDYTYGRDGKGRLQVTVVDATQAGRATVYDAFGRVVEQHDAFGQKTVHEYDRAKRSLTVISPEGVRVTTVFDLLGQTQSVTDGNNNTRTFSYDADGNLKVTATRISSELRDYDRAGLLLRTTSGDNVVEFTYDGANRVLKRTVKTGGPNLTTHYAYDAKGQQVEVTDPAGTKTAFVYDLNGRVERQVVDPLGLKLETIFTYDSLGRVQTVLPPGGPLTEYGYDALGRRTSEIVDPRTQAKPHALHLTRLYTYDDVGNLVTSEDANGHVTRYTYDAEHRLIYTVDAAGNVSRSSYDQEGRLETTRTYKQAIQPALLGAVPTAQQIEAQLGTDPPVLAATGRTYDKDGRLVATVNLLGEVVHFQYDGNGNVTERTAFAKTVTTWAPGTVPQPVPDPVSDRHERTVYDALNRAVYTIDAAGGLVAQEYDSNGNLLKRTAFAQAIDPKTAVADLEARARAIAQPGRDAVIRNVFDAANRLTRTIDGTGAVTDFAYDDAGRIKQRIQYAEPHAPDATTIATSTADRVSCYAYDAAGRQRFGVDATGTVTEQVHDAAGNLLQRTVYAARVAAPVAGTSYTDRDLDRLTADSSANRVEHFGYDAVNRQVRRVDATGAATETTYDAIGRVLLVRQLHGTSADDAKDRLTAYSYADTQRHSFVADAVGHVTETLHDALGRAVETIEHYTPIAMPGQPSTVASHALDRRTTYTYDAAGRLKSSQDALRQEEESYSYDGVGNRLSFTNKKGAAWTYEYDAAGRMVAENSPQAALAAVTTDAAGNLVLDDANTRTDSVRTVLAYDALGNLTARTEAWGRPEERTTRYEYDALGRQVKTIHPLAGVYEPAWDDLAANGATGAPERKDSYVELASTTHYDVFGDAVAGRDTAGNYSYKSYDEAGRLVWEVDALGHVTGYTRSTFGDAETLTRYEKPVSLSSATGLSRGRIVVTDGKPVAEGVPSGSSLPGVPGVSFVDGVLRWSTPVGTATTLRARLLGSTVWTEVVAVQKNGFAEARVPATLPDGVYELELEQRTTEGVRAQAVADTLRTSPNDRSIRTEYDKAGRATRVTEPATDIYDGDTRKVYHDAQKQTKTAYNAFGEATVVEVLENPGSATWNATRHFYDDLGRLVATRDAMGYLTTQAYDKFGNLESRTEFADPAGLPADGSAPVGGSSGKNRVTSYTYDALNRKLSETRTAEASRTELAARADGVLTIRPRQPASAELTLTTSGEQRVPGLGLLTNPAGGAVLQWQTPFGGATPVLHWRRVDAPVWENVSALVVTEGDRQSFFIAAGLPVDSYEFELSFQSESYYGLETGRVRILAPVVEAPALAGLPPSSNAPGIANVSLATIEGKQVVRWPTPAAGTVSTLRYKLPGGTEWFDAPVELTVDGATQYAVVPGDIPAGDYLLQLDFTSFVSAGSATTHFGYDAVGNLIRIQDAMDGVTRNYYDALGRLAAVVTPPVNDAAGPRPLTEFSHDAHGNVLRTIARANGAATADGSGYTRTASVADRVEFSAFDRLGRALQTTDAESVSRFFSYDARGNLAKSWQTVESGSGLATLYERSEYDALGRLVRTVQPAAAGIDGITSGSSVTETAYNAFGEKTGRKVDTKDAEYWLYDAAGRVWRTNEGDGVERITLHDLQGRATVDIRSAGSGGADKAIASIGSPEDILNSFANDKGLRVTYSRYDKLGRLVGQELPLRQEAQGGVAAQHLLADGEILATAVPSFAPFQMKWLPANRVQLRWNSLHDLGPGEIKVELQYVTSSYDVPPTTVMQGTDQVFQIQGYPVAGVAKSLTRYFTAEEAAAGALLQWTDPDGSSQGGVGAITRAIVHKKDLYGIWRQVVDQSAVHLNPAPASHVAGVGSMQPSRNTLTGDVIWDGTNSVTLEWPSLAALGAGDVKVDMEYYTLGGSLSAVQGNDGGPEGGNIIDLFPAVNFTPTLRTLTRTFNSAASQYGAVLQWADGSNTEGGISAVKRVVVSKLNGQGQWVPIPDPQPQPHAGNVLTLDAPTDPRTVTALEYRPAGSAGAWTRAQPLHFGERLRLDLHGLLQGSYEYRVLTTPEGQALSITAEGTFTLSPPELATIASPITTGGWAPGVFGWRSPPAGVAQTFRYRPLGSTGVWGTLAVTALGNGYSGVDSSVLVGNTYEYELLYTKQGHLQPYAHATGQFEAFAAQGLPHIAGVTLAPQADGNIRVEWPDTTALGQPTQVSYKPVGTDQWLPVGSAPGAAGQPNVATVASFAGGEPTRHAFGGVTWSADNHVPLNWSSLAGLGDGEVMVEMQYLTWAGDLPAVTTTGGGDAQNEEVTVFPATSLAGSARTLSQVFSSAEAMAGAVLNWSNGATVEDGISAVQRVQVYKKNAAGAWLKVADSDPQLAPPTVASGATQVAIVGAGLASGDYDVQVLRKDAAGHAIATATALVTLRPLVYPPVTAVDTTPAFIPGHTVPAENLPYVEGFAFDPRPDGSWTLAWNAPADAAAVAHFRLRPQGAVDWIDADSRILTSQGRQSVTAAPLEVQPGPWEMEVFFESAGVRTHQAMGLMTVFAAQDVPPTLAVTTPPYVPAAMLFEDFDDNIAQGLTPFRNHVDSFATWTAKDGFLYGAGGGGAAFGESYWADYEAEVDFRFEGAVGNDAGLAFRVQDEDNWYQLRMNNGQLRVMQYVGGRYSMPAEIPFTPIANQTYKLKVQVSGTTARAFVDGQHLLTATGLLIPRGKVGVLQDAPNSARYDNLKVVVPSISIPGQSAIATSFTPHPDGSWTWQWPAPPAGAQAVLNYRQQGSPTWVNANHLIQSSGANQQAVIAAGTLPAGQWEVEVFYTQYGLRTAQATGVVTVAAPTRAPATITPTTPPYVPESYDPGYGYPPIPGTIQLPYAGGGTALYWDAPPAGSVATFNYKPSGTSSWININGLIQTSGSQQYIVVPSGLPVGDYDLELTFTSGGQITNRSTGRLEMRATSQQIYNTTPPYQPPTYTPAQNYPVIPASFSSSTEAWSLSWPTPPAGSSTVLKYRFAGSPDWLDATAFIQHLGATQRIDAGSTVLATGRYEIDLHYVSGGVRTAQATGLLDVKPASGSLYDTFQRSGTSSYLWSHTSETGHTWGGSPYRIDGGLLGNELLTRGDAYPLNFTLPEGNPFMEGRFTIGTSGAWAVEFGSWEGPPASAPDVRSSAIVLFNTTSTVLRHGINQVPTSGEVIATFPGSPTTLPAVNTLRIDTTGITLNGVHYAGPGLVPGKQPFVRVFGGGSTPSLRPKLLSLEMGVTAGASLQLTTPAHVPPIEIPAQNLPEIALALAEDGRSIFWQAPPAGTTTSFRYKPPGAADFVDASGALVTEGGLQRIPLAPDAAAGDWQFEVKYVVDGAEVAQGTGTLTVHPDWTPAPTLVSTTPTYKPPVFVPDQNYPVLEGVQFVAQPDGGWTLSWPKPPQGQLAHLGIRPHDDANPDVPFNYDLAAARMTETQDGRQQIVVARGELPVGTFDLDLYYSLDGQRVKQATGTVTAHPPTQLASQFTMNTPPYVPARYSVVNGVPGADAASHGVPQTFQGTIDGAIPGTAVIGNADGTLSFVWNTPPAPTTAVFSYKLQGSATWIEAAAQTVGAQQRLDVPMELPPGRYDVKLELVSGGAVQATSAGVVIVPTHVAAGAGLPSSTDSRLAQSKVRDGHTFNLQAVSERVLDRWGNVLQQNDLRNSNWVTRSQYNADNQLIQQERFGGAITRTRYDALGRQIAVTDANGYTNLQRWDAAGNVVAEVHADGGVVKHRYDAFADRVATTNELNHTTDFAYDRLGRLRTTLYAAAAVHHIDGNDNRWPLIPDGMQRMGEYTGWDRAGRKVAQARSGEFVTYQYDLRGNVVETTQMGVTLRMAHDTQGRKIKERDGNGNEATWTYDYFGQLTKHTDIGGAKYLYTHDNARQLRTETNDRSGTQRKDVRYDYDAAGQLVLIWDQTLLKETNYQYDLAGNRVRERTVQAGAVYQDNHLAYDELGRLSWVTDGRAWVEMHYDQAGNRTHIHSHVVNTDTTHDQHRYFLYDAMGRQVVADAADAQGTNLGTDGHRITYDKAGNKKTDTWYGNVVTVIPGGVWRGLDWEGNQITYHIAPRYEAQVGFTTEAYAHDALGRITTIARDGVTVDERSYDAGGRIVQTGVAGLDPNYIKKLHGTNSKDQALQGNGTEVRSHLYDANGRLLRQRVHNSAGDLRYEIDFGNETGTAHIDGAGNQLTHWLHNYDGSRYDYRYTHTHQALEGYKEVNVLGERMNRLPRSPGSGWVPAGQVGESKMEFDANGFLTKVTESPQTLNSRYFVNDASGKVLYGNQGGHVQRQLIAMGEVLGRYGEVVDNDEPRGPQGEPVFKTAADFKFGFEATGGDTPVVADRMHTVAAGDTLQSIAQLHYGDSRLWYRVAEANGLMSNEELVAGQVLKVPGTEVSGNAANTFRPYDPSEVIGDTSPYIPLPPPPKNGCGGVGQIIMLVVAIVATIFTAGAAAMALGTVTGTTSAFGAGLAVLGGGSAVVGGVAVTVGAGVVSAGAAVTAGLVIGSAVGSIASQAVGIAIGAQDKFSWKQVGLAALSAGVGAGVGQIPALSGPGLGATIGRAVVGNVLTQGLAVATGLQESFNWRGVAASAVGAGIGHAVGTALGPEVLPEGVAGPVRPAAFSEFGATGDVLRSGITRSASRLGAAIAQGGKISVKQIVIDAFGNALGSSLAESSNRVGPVEHATDNGGGASEDVLGAFIELNDGWSSVSAAPTFAEDTAMRRAGLNPMGLPKSGGATDGTTMGAGPLAPRTYTVQSGDNPASIGRAFFGDERAGAAILAANGLNASVRGARSLQVGQVLTLPDDLDSQALRAGGALIHADNSTRMLEAEARANTLRMSGGPRGGTGVAYGDAPLVASTTSASGVAFARGLEATFLDDYSSVQNGWSNWQHSTFEAFDAYALRNGNHRPTLLASAAVKGAATIGFALGDAGLAVGRLGALAHDSYSRGTLFADLRNYVTNPVLEFVRGYPDMNVVRLSATLELPTGDSWKAMVGTDRIGYQYKTSASVPLPYNSKFKFDSVVRTSMRFDDFSVSDEMMLEANFAKFTVANVAGGRVGVDVVPGARVNLSGNQIITPSTNLDVGLSIPGYKVKFSIEGRRAGS